MVHGDGHHQRAVLARAVNTGEALGTDRFDVIAHGIKVPGVNGCLRGWADESTFGTLVAL